MTDDPGRPTLYLRCAGAAGIAAAADLGADGVSLELEIDEAGTVHAGGERLELLIGTAEEHGLAVELVAGRPLDPQPATALIAAIVAELVSGRRVREDVRLSSFDHVAVTAIGRNAAGLGLGARHLVTLHRGEEYAARAGMTALHPLAQEVSRPDVERARAAGLATHAWTLTAAHWPISEEEQVRRALDAGVDAVTLSDPDLVTTQRSNA